jgi:hypothetical protein
MGILTKSRKISPWPTFPLRDTSLEFKEDTDKYRPQIRKLNKEMNSILLQQITEGRRMRN